MAKEDKNEKEDKYASTKKPRKEYTRKFKTIKCERCGDEYIAMTLRKDTPNRCGTCNVIVNVKEYRKKINANFKPFRY